MSSEELAALEKSLCSLEEPQHLTLPILSDTLETATKELTGG